MCVMVWAERHPAPPAGPRIPAKGVKVPYVEENILYDLAESRVDILILTAIDASDSDPFLLHLVHRRHVIASDCTPQLLRPSSVIQRARYQLRHPSLGERSDPAAVAMDVLRIGGGSDRIIGAVPIRENFTTRLDFGFDLSEADEAVVPYTSVRFGPMEQCDRAYVLGVALTIRPPAFNTLVNRVNQYGVKFHYGIEGPEIVRSDIKNLDLFGLPGNVAARYRGLFEESIEPCKLTVQNYDVLTYDDPNGHCEYNRVYVQTQHVLRDVELHLGSGERLRANGWHSDREDFLIQRVSLFDR